MFVAELFENPQKQLVVIYAGRFQPFHKGHKAVYDYLCKKYGRDHVFIATSNKTDSLKSPFNFSDKSQFMIATGISMDRVIESSQPYKVPELTSKLDMANTIMIFAVSQKDMDEDPRFTPGTKKDGSPTYFQMLPKDMSTAVSADKHGYLEVVPTFNFTVLGQPMTSASEIRAQYKQSDDQTKTAIIKDLFGSYTPELKHILDSRLGTIGEGKIANALAAGALATGMLAAPAQAQNVGDLARAGVVGLRTANSISGITKAGVKDELRQELRAIARGDANHSAVLGYGNNNQQRALPGIDANADTPAASAERMNARNKMMRGEDTEVDETISKVKDGYRLVSHSGKNLGTYPSKAGAEKREKQVQYFKHMGEDAAGVGVIASKKQAKDPRYSTSLTVDVRPDTPKKNRKALYLEDVVSKITALQEEIAKLKGRKQ